MTNRFFFVPAMLLVLAALAFSQTASDLSALTATDPANVVANDAAVTAVATANNVYFNIAADSPRVSRGEPVVVRLTTLVPVDATSFMVHEDFVGQPFVRGATSSKYSDDYPADCNGTGYVRALEQGDTVVLLTKHTSPSRLWGTHTFTISAYDQQGNLRQQPVKVSVAVGYGAVDTTGSIRIDSVEQFAGKYNYPWIRVKGSFPKGINLFTGQGIPGLMGQTVVHSDDGVKIELPLQLYNLRPLPLQQLVSFLNPNGDTATAIFNVTVQ